MSSKIDFISRQIFAMSHSDSQWLLSNGIIRKGFPWNNYLLMFRNFREVIGKCTVRYELFLGVAINIWYSGIPLIALGFTIIYLNTRVLQSKNFSKQCICTKYPNFFLESSPFKNFAPFRMTWHFNQCPSTFRCLGTDCHIADCK